MYIIQARKSFLERNIVVGFFSLQMLIMLLLPQAMFHFPRLYWWQKRYITLLKTSANS